MGGQTSEMDATRGLSLSMIARGTKIAIVAGDRLGDGLIIQLITYNLYLQGYDVVLFNTPLLTLKEWFPWCTIKPHFPQGESPEHLKDFDTLIFQHPNRHAKDPILPSQKKIVLYGEPLYMKRRSLVDIYYDCCQKVLGLELVTRTNGIKIPKGLSYRKYSKRVIIHPMSLRPEKNWPKDKFIELGHKLQKLGFDPVYTVSPLEAPLFSDLKEHGFELVVFPKLKDLAVYLYESGFLIGNDSGLSHLASSLQIPTVTLFIRPGVAKRWKPNFYACYPVLPWLHLPGPKLKEKYWKKMVSVSQVLKALLKAVKDHPAEEQPHTFA